MKRKQIYLEPEQDRRLRALSRRQGRTESELIREGVTRVLADPPLDRKAWERARNFMEKLMAEGPVSGGRTWTRDELHER